MTNEVRVVRKAGNEMLRQGLSANLMVLCKMLSDTRQGGAQVMTDLAALLRAKVAEWRNDYPIHNDMDHSYAIHASAVQSCADEIDAALAQPAQPNSEIRQHDCAPDEQCSCYYRGETDERHYWEELRAKDQPNSQTLREALECAEYALAHPESNQKFALDAVRAALAQPNAGAADYTLVPNSALRWLFGEEGDFGEAQSNLIRPKYWWRSEFRKRMLAGAAPQGEKR